MILETLVIALIIILTLLYYFFYYIKFTYIKSSVDNKIYKVKNNALAQQSADALASININLIKLINYIKFQPNPPEYVSRFYKFNPSVLEENILDIDTTYTIDKGESMLFCLSDRIPSSEILKVYDINTLMYVAIHELSHIITISIGHTLEFKDNFKSLLKYAVNCGVYKYIDYSKSPTNYCGIQITQNVI